MTANLNFHPFLYKPMEITGFWDESNSWHDGCYINSSLNTPAPFWEIEGPDTEKVLQKYIVNSLSNRPIGKGLHAIMCSDDGKIVSDGIFVKRGEHKYRSLIFMAMSAIAQMEAGNENVKFTDITGQVVMYQFCGPRSLELMEAVTKQDLHELKFMYYTESSIDGMPVEVFRVGMAGSLGYEIHCRTEDSVKIYHTIMAIGEDYGLRHLGWQAYRNAHTEGGFPQSSVHFWYADPTHQMDHVYGTRKRPEDPAEVRIGTTDASDQLMSDNDSVEVFASVLMDGSFSDVPYSEITVTPYDVGWDKMVKFDHEFIGRAALEKIAKAPKRTVVTLEWNKDDIADVWLSIFDEGEPYKRMDVVADLAPYGEFEYIPALGVAAPHSIYMEFDRVFADGKEIGISSNRMFSPHYRKMISMCIIDRDQTEIGKEVEILWGNPGTRQKKIRATVQRFPLVDTNRNEKMDVASIPRKY